MAYLINLERLKEEVDGLEEYIEKTSGDIENTLERLDRVKRMVFYLQEQAKKLEEKSNN